MADQKSINELLKEANRLKNEAKKILADESKGQAALAIDVKKNNTEYKNRLALLKEINSQIQKQRAAQKERIGSLMMEEQKIKSFTGLQQSIAGIERKKVKLLAKQGSMHDDQKDAFGRISDLNRELLELSAEDIVSSKEISRQIEAELDALDEKAKRQDGLDDDSRELLALMKEEYGIAQNISNLTQDQQKQLEAQLSAYDGMKTAVGGVLNTLSVLTSTAGAAVGGLLIGVGMVADKFGEVNRQLGSGFDLLNKTNLSAGVLSFIFEDTAGTVKALTAEFGDASAATFSLQANVGLMATNFGISNTEAASLVGSFARLNGGSTDVASDMVKTTQEFAKQNGVIPSALMSDLAASTEEFALYGKDGGENILRAAGYAQKLGVSMKTLSGIADNLLDFESSITKELELGAMLGKNINLNQARQLAYAGDIEGATKATLNALGGVDAFNRMDYFQKKATADLLGTSVAELDKMVKNQENAGQMGSVINEKFSKMNEFLDAGLNKYLGTGLKGLGGMVVMAGQLNFGFKAMGTSIGGIVKGIGRGIVGLAKWVIQGTVFLAKMVASAALSIFNGTAFKKAGAGLTSMVTGAKSFFNSMKGGEGVLGGLKKGFSSIGDKVKGVFSKKPTTGVTDIAGDASKNATDVTDKGSKVKGGSNIGKSLKSLAGGLKEMGNAKVLFGALNLIPTGLGFVGILPGLPGMLGVSMLGAGAGTGVLSLSKGLKQMGNAKVAFGALNLIPAGIGFAAMTVGVIGMGAISLLGITAGAGLTALGTGLSVFGTPTVTLGAANLALAAVGFTLMTAGSIGLAAIALGGIAAGVGLSALAAGLSAFAASAPVALIGIGLLALLGVALIPVTYALSLLTPIIEAFGNVVTNVMGGVATIITTMVPAIQAFGNVITSVFSGLSGLVTSVADGFVKLTESITLEKIAAMALLGPALLSASAGLGAFSLALAAAGVGSFFGGGIFEKMEKMASFAQPLNTTATALNAMANGFKNINTSLSALDADKLKALEDFSISASIGGAIAGIGESVSGVIDTIGGLLGGDEEVGEEDKTTLLIEEIRGLRADLNQGKVAVYMDGEKVTARVSNVVDKIGSNSFALK